MTRRSEPRSRNRNPNPNPNQKPTKVEETPGGDPGGFPFQMTLAIADHSHAAAGFQYSEYRCPKIAEVVPGCPRLSQPGTSADGCRRRRDSGIPNRETAADPGKIHVGTPGGGARQAAGSVSRICEKRSGASGEVPDEMQRRGMSRSEFGSAVQFTFPGDLGCVPA